MVQKAFYRDYASKFKNAQNLLERERLASVLAKGENILDVGCGEGKSAEFINSKNLYGLDIVGENLDKAKKKGYKEVACVDLNCQPIPFPDKYFDCCIVMETLEHLFDPIYALSEINRVLKISGCIIISVPNIGWLLPRISLLLGTFSDFHDFQLVPCHIRFFTIARLTKILSVAGFNKVKVYGTTDFASKIIIQKVLNLLAKIYPSVFSSNPVFYANKNADTKMVYSYEQISGFKNAVKKLLEYK